MWEVSGPWIDFSRPTDELLLRVKNRENLEYSRLYFLEIALRGLAYLSRSGWILLHSNVKEYAKENFKFHVSQKCKEANSISRCVAITLTRGHIVLVRVGVTFLKMHSMSASSAFPSLE